MTNLQASHVTVPVDVVPLVAMLGRGMQLTTSERARVLEVFAPEPTLAEGIAKFLSGPLGGQPNLYIGLAESLCELIAADLEALPSSPRARDVAQIERIRDYQQAPI